MLHKLARLRHAQHESAEAWGHGLCRLSQTLAGARAAALSAPKNLGSIALICIDILTLRRLIPLIASKNSLK